ncbi:MAG: queuosine salvage family protein [Acidobacteriota bacterium]
MTLLEKVRESCRSVAEEAAAVRINPDAIRSYGVDLIGHSIQPPRLDPGRHYLGRGDDTAAFFVILDSINYGSGYFLHLRKRPGMSGYFTLAAWLTDFFQLRGAPSARELSRITGADCTRIFHQDPDDSTVSELMELFAQSLRDLGDHLTRRFSGSFAALIRAADSSAEELVKRLIEMPHFQDVAPYHSREVSFYKRAQLMAADLALAFNGRGLGYFTDLSSLTLFADNLVPHVLRVDGLLEYTVELAARIDSAQLIPSGSAPEVEIRACALQVVELLVQECRKSGKKITPMEADYLLWNRGQQPYYKKTRPRHRTRCVFY